MTNPEQVRQANGGWTRTESGNFTAVMKPSGGQIDPDSKGAKQLVNVLRYAFWVKDYPNGEDAVKEIPEKVMLVPYHRAVDMIQNREAKFIAEDDAAPLWEKQRAEDRERARVAKIEADALIDQLKAEKGEIPDVVDPEADKKIAELTATVAAQAEQMKQLMAMQAAFMQQFGQAAPGAGTTVLDED